MKRQRRGKSNYRLAMKCNRTGKCREMGLKWDERDACDVEEMPGGVVQRSA